MIAVGVRLFSSGVERVVWLDGNFAVDFLVSGVSPSASELDWRRA